MSLASPNSSQLNVTACVEAVYDILQNSSDRNQGTNIAVSQGTLNGLSVADVATGFWGFLGGLVPYGVDQYKRFRPKSILKSVHPQYHGLLDLVGNMQQESLVEKFEPDMFASHMAQYNQIVDEYSEIQQQLESRSASSVTFLAIFRNGRSLSGSIRALGDMIEHLDDAIRTSSNAAKHKASTLKKMSKSPLLTVSPAIFFADGTQHASDPTVLQPGSLTAAEMDVIRRIQDGLVSRGLEFVPSGINARIASKMSKLAHEIMLSHRYAGADGDETQPTDGSGDGDEPAFTAIFFLFPTKQLTASAPSSSPETVQPANKLITHAGTKLQAPLVQHSTRQDAAVQVESDLARNANAAVQSNRGPSSGTVAIVGDSAALTITAEAAVSDSGLSATTETVMSDDRMPVVIHLVSNPGCHASGSAEQKPVRTAKIPSLDGQEVTEIVA